MCSAIPETSANGRCVDSEFFVLQDDPITVVIDLTSAPLTSTDARIEKKQHGKVDPQSIQETGGTVGVEGAALMVCSSGSL